MGIKRMFDPQDNLDAETNCRLELTKVIQDNAPDAIQSGDIKNQFGRKIAIDAYVLAFLLSSDDPLFVPPADAGVLVAPCRYTRFSSLYAPMDSSFSLTPDRLHLT